MLVHVVRGCAVANNIPILPHGFVHQIFPNAVKIILDSSDCTILQVCAHSVLYVLLVSLSVHVEWWTMCSSICIHCS